MSIAESYRPHYTVEDYLQWEGDWELWNGSPVSMSPAPSPYHQSVATELASLARNGLKNHSACCGCVALCETDWKVSSDTIVRPDVLITCDPLPKLHIVSPPVFIAEILSPSTASKDRTAKRALYESSRVKYYAIVDPNAQSVDLLELNDGTFVERDTKNDPVNLKLTGQCSIPIDFGELFANA